MPAKATAPLVLEFTPERAIELLDVFAIILSRLEMFFPKDRRVIFDSVAEVTEKLGAAAKEAT